jgi:FkbM family methyltransferase
VLDVGAYVGTYTREALRQGAVKVIAIEPAPHNLECLQRNLRAEIASGMVIVYPKGAWNKDEMLEMFTESDNELANSFLYGSKRTGIKLPLTTIDQMVEELRLPTVDFIKMDIEGAEREALQGAAGTIRRFHPRMAICVYHIPDDVTVVPELIRTIEPRYQRICGPCLNSGPEVFFFRM